MKQKKAKSAKRLKEEEEEEEEGRSKARHTQCSSGKKKILYLHDSTEFSVSYCS
jgi:hypothetical protein